jgi:four helix bundle protein
MIQGLEDFKTYNKAMQVAKKVYDIVSKWNYFEKDTIGKQLVRSVDSIAANLSEGLGRYHYKEIRNFSYYSRGSLFETKTWLTKAHTRKLVDETFYNEFIKELDVIGRMMNTYINSIGERAGGVNEPEEEYRPMPNPQPPNAQPPNPQCLTP